MCCHLVVKAQGTGLRSDNTFFFPQCRKNVAPGFSFVVYFNAMVTQRQASVSVWFVFRFHSIVTLLGLKKDSDSQCSTSGWLFHQIWFKHSQRSERVCVPRKHRNTKMPHPQPCAFGPIGVKSELLPWPMTNNQPHLMQTMHYYSKYPVQRGRDVPRSPLKPPTPTRTHSAS